MTPYYLLIGILFLIVISLLVRHGTVLKERDYLKSHIDKRAVTSAREGINARPEDTRKMSKYVMPGADGLIDVVIRFDTKDGRSFTYDGLKDGVYGYNVLHDSMTLVIQFGMYVQTYSGLDSIEIKDRHYHV